MAAVKQSLTQSLKSNAKFAFVFIVVIWLIKIVEVQFGISFHFLGVYPNEIRGLTGILTAPLIHGSFEHLAGNSLPLLILLTGLFYGYPNSKYKTILLIWFLSGLGTWLFAREAWHFGASGLTHGLCFFLLLASILRRDKRSIALMMIAFFMYGGMLMSIFPREQHISFEYHLFGALAGLLAAVLFRNADPKLQEKTYSWEQQSDDRDNSEDDLIGDEWQLVQTPSAPPEENPAAEDSAITPGSENDSAIPIKRE